jgi:glycosyl transferase family 61
VPRCAACDERTLPATQPGEVLPGRNIAAWLIAEADRLNPPPVVTHLYPAESISCAPPAGLYGGDRFFPEFARIDVEAPFTAALDGAELCADAVNAALLAPGGRPIWDLSHWHEVPTEEHWLLAGSWTSSKDFSGTLAPIIVQPGWGRAYYHWMFEVLPRVHLVQASPHRVDMYALHSCKERFQVETLRMLGVKPDEILELTEPTRIRSSRLVVTPVLEAVAPLWVCNFLRRLFFGSEPVAVEQRRRLYISRAGAKRGRPVANEREIEKVLSSRGFETVRLEELSVREQAELFASAEVVVGPHGAGFANLVFCQPGAKIVEFFNRSYVHPLYWMLSNRLELQYLAFIAGEKGPRSWSSWPTQGGSDPITVDKRALVDLLTNAEIT